MHNYLISYNCYHGTTSKNSNIIITNKEFTYEYREDHWLGNGVYFFIEDEMKGKWWARNAVKKEKRLTNETHEPVVIYIMVNVERRNLLNLNTEEGQKILKEFNKFLKDNKKGIVIEKRAGETEVSKKRRALCTLLDLLSTSLDFKASCYLFGGSNIPNLFRLEGDYGLSNNNGNQLCVYDSSILDFNTYEEITV
ncbi:hypothetical protein JIN86_19605 [Lysinibacillus sp. HST-98]|uniref:hypothetical protein n=1 Tax=Lysinibacillus sp. HST-98 TaxID=2800419 RepID=UPI001925C039|nr:hypothetical protein [Lysinibacillus sp. HST-98]MBL3731780.1 hypothetical protein [Lysinibacillus sp. HST-98]